MHVVVTSDVNECLYADKNTCDTTVEDCVNTNGSFNCVCKAGFYNNSGTCEGQFIFKLSTNSLSGEKKKETEQFFFSALSLFLAQV